MELSSRLDRGSCNFSPASATAHSTAAELYGVVLAARVAAAHRELVSEVLVSVNQAHVPGVMERLRTAPIDRRRIASGASDASNILQVYGILQQSLRLPSLKVSCDRSTTGMGGSTVFRAERAAHVECPAGRDFPLGSDWCIVEHEGERVLGRVKDHFLRRAASQCSLALLHLASQGRVLRHAPVPLPPSRSQALLRLRKGPVGAARSAARSLTSTHVTRRELRRWSPATHDSDGCWLPGCSEITPDSQDHALLECPSTKPEREALLDELRAALCRAGPQHCHYWLALTSGPRIGADRARVASLAAFASTGVAASLVGGVPLALIRRHADDLTAAEHPTLGAVVRRTAASPPPCTTTRSLLSSWCAVARDQGHRWVAVPEKILHNCVFRWQAADNRSPDELLESIAAAAAAQSHSFARLWPTLHHSVIDIVQDSLGVTACLSTCALTAPRRSAAVVLAPGLPATPLDPLVCCHSWSPRALSDAAANHGLLALLPHASAPGAGEAYAALTSRGMPVTAAGDGARVVLLVPWDAPGAPSADSGQNAAVASLFRKGFIPVAVLHPQLVPVFHLEAFGPGLFEQRGAVSQSHHLLLTSWLPPADQLAGALVALGTLAQLRNGPASSPPPVQLPWLLERCVSSQDGEAVRRDVTWSRWLGNVNPLVTSVVGASDYVDSVLARAAALLALPPDEFLLPRLHHPLPAGAPAAPPCHPQSYLGAALDDDDQPESSASCAWLPTVTLAAVSAGIVPDAIHATIIPWLHRRSRSAERSTDPLPRFREAGGAVDPLHRAPDPPAEPRPRQPRVLAEPCPPRPRADPAPRYCPVATSVAMIQRSAQLWIRRRTLTAQQLSLVGAPSRRQRVSGRPRTGRQRPGSTQSPLPDAVESHRLHAHRTPVAAAAVAPVALHTAAVAALLVPPSLPEPPARRVLRPGRDPDADTAPRHGGMAPHG